MNQPLTVIVMKGAAAGRLLGKTPADSERVKAILEDIVKSGYRAGAVLENIRALFKPDDQPRSAVEMNQLISDGLQILRSELDSLGISVRKHFDPRLPSVFGHKGQLQEVILNLVQNSIDAMQNTKDQKRLIQVETKCLDQKMILISVSDSGPGFNPDNISNIFEAFATTKSTGMGLGLAISQGIVERHGGKISAATNPNGGAKLEITLPIAPDTILQAADVRNEVGYRG
jgi:signal transduction histidine kinase